MPTVVLGVTGCIGAYKACEVLRELQKRDVDVHVAMTEHATRFVSALTMEALSRHPVFVDQFALGGESEIQHVSWADAADLLLVAPATANMIGKFAHGIADRGGHRPRPLRVEPLDRADGPSPGGGRSRPWRACGARLGTDVAPGARRRRARGGALRRADVEGRAGARGRCERRRDGGRS